MSGRSALARLSDNPFNTDDHLSSSSSSQPSSPGWMVATYLTLKGRAQDKVATTFTDLAKAGPSRISSGSTSEGQVSAGRAWAGELGVKEGSASMTPTRPPAALGDAVGWCKVPSVKTFQDMQIPGGTRASTLSSLGTVSNTSSRYPEPPSIPPSRLEFGEAVAKMMGVSVSPIAQQSQLRPDIASVPPPPATSSGPRRSWETTVLREPASKQLVEVEDMVRETVLNLSPTNVDGGKAPAAHGYAASPPAAGQSQSAEVEVDTITLMPSPPKADFDSIIAKINTPPRRPVLASQSCADQKNIQDQIYTPKSAVGHVADHSQIDASMPADTLFTLSPDSEGFSFALSRRDSSCEPMAKPLMPRGMKLGTSRPSAFPADKDGDQLYAAPLQHASQMLREGGAVFDPTVTTVFDSSTELEDEEDTALMPMASPWTGKKAPLDWSFIPKGGSPILDESACGVTMLSGRFGGKGEEGANETMDEIRSTNRGESCQCTAVTERSKAEAALGHTDKQMRELEEAERELKEAFERILGELPGVVPLTGTTLEMLQTTVAGMAGKQTAAVSAGLVAQRERSGGGLPHTVLVFGGYEDVAIESIVTGCEAVTMTHDARGGDWEAILSPEGARGGAGAACVEGSCFLVGGFDGNCALDDATVLSLTPRSHAGVGQGGWQRWERVRGRMSMPRFSCGVAALGAKLLAIGGTDGRKVLASVDCLYTKAREWGSCRAGSLNVPRAACAAAAVGGKVYVVGGYGANGAPLASTEVYDEARGTWEVHPGLMKEARMDCGVCSVGHLLVAVGGRGEGGLLLGSCEVYDTKKGGGWIQCAGCLNVPRAGMGIVSLGGRVLAIAGSDGSGLLNSWEEYDVASDIWRMLPSKLVRSRGACSAVVTGSIVSGV